MCSGCREMKPKNELIRVVRTPEGKIMVDNSGKVSGRGAYVCKNEECFNKSVKTKALSRTLDVQVEDEVLLQLKKEING
jgi:predicted RNA-binding protein YlxR (DUF448 family)